MNRASATASLASLDRHAPAVARVGLGLVVLLAGVHKLLDPAAWAVYVTPWLADRLPMTPVEFMLLNGVLEPPFAVGLLLDRYTVAVGAFVTLSLAATVVYLAVAALTTGLFVDVLVRDVGLVALGTTVTLDAATRAHTES